MKFILVLAFVGVACSAPAPHEIDWAGVEDRWKLIQNGTIPNGFPLIKAIATAENPAVGEIISAKLDSAAIDGTLFLDRVTPLIEARNLTRNDTEVLLGDYFSLFLDLQLEITEDAKVLSKAAQYDIESVFWSYPLFDMYMSYHIFYFVDETPFIPTDWAEVDRQLPIMANLLTVGANYIKQVARNDDAEAGEIITVKVDEAMNQIKDVITYLEVLSYNQALELRESLKLFQDMTVLLSKLRDNIDTELGQLSLGASQAILLAFQLGHGDIFQVGSLVHDLVAQVVFFTCPPDDVCRHVSELWQMGGLGANRI